MAEIKLERVGRRLITLVVEGISPLRASAFTLKAQEMMLLKQMNQPVQREAKDPEALFNAARHVLADGSGDGFPSVGFKAAMVDAARFYKGSKLPMTDLRIMLFVDGEPGNDADGSLLVPIMGEWTGSRKDWKPAVPVRTQAYVRNDSGVADIRFRPQYWPWSAELKIVAASVLSLETVVALADAAGMVGVGEWRPGSKESKTGSYGTFRVLDEAGVTEAKL